VGVPAEKVQPHCDFMPFHEVDFEYYWGNETVDHKELLRDLDISYLFTGACT
jgi:hypothetical protein